MDALRKRMSCRRVGLSITALVAIGSRDIAATLATALAGLLVACAGRTLTRHARGGFMHVPNHSVSQ